MPDPQGPGSPRPGIQDPGSRIHDPGCRILNRGSRIQDPPSGRGPGSRILQDPGSSIESRGLKVLRILSYVISGRPTPNLATNLALPQLLYMNGPRNIFLQIDIWSLPLTSFRDFPENVFIKTLHFLSLSLYIYVFCFCALLIIFFSTTCKKSRTQGKVAHRIGYRSHFHPYQFWLKPTSQPFYT